VIPLHPRTRKVLSGIAELNNMLDSSKNIKIVPPASYLDMIALECNAEMVMTDSGGVQKEAYYFKKACIILQSETAWVELVESGCAELTDDDPTRIEAAFYSYRSKKNALEFKPLFGDGKAAEFTVSTIIRYLNA